MADIFISASGIGSSTSLPLSAEVEIDISDDGTFADFCVTNTTPTSSSNPDPLIDQFLFNLGDPFDATETQLQISNVVYIPDGGSPVTGDWVFDDSAGSPTGDFDHNSGGCGSFQYIVEEDSGQPDHRLNSGDTVCFRLSVINPSANPSLRFDEDVFLTAPDAANGTTQAAFSFQQLGPTGALSDCLGADFEGDGEE